jgi:hypothetical protein
VADDDLTALLEQREQKIRELLRTAQDTSLDLKDPKLLGRHIPGWHSWGDVEAVCGEALFSVAAVRAVLELHRRSDKPARTRHVCRDHAYAHHPGPQWRAAVDTCPDCAVTEKYVCTHEACRHDCPDDDKWPCPTIRAIRTALTSVRDGSDEKENSDGELQSRSRVAANPAAA